ncbi:hypothetical protein Tco_1574976, partial [Tanacetum coccineum]
IHHQIRRDKKLTWDELLPQSEADKIGMICLNSQRNLTRFKCYLGNNPSYQGINISKFIKQVSIIHASCEKQADTTRVHRTGLHAPICLALVGAGADCWSGLLELVAGACC